ncbi:hypothetical protein L9F63_000260, partial [Diploptera punctata]
VSLIRHMFVEKGLYYIHLQYNSSKHLQVLPNVLKNRTIEFPDYNDPTWITTLSPPHFIPDTRIITMQFREITYPQQCVSDPSAPC